jgi:hypothetical protein
MAPILGIYASQISGHLFAPSGSYDSIATVTVGSGGVGSISFTSIPSTYTHLQIRGIGRSATTNNAWRVRFNGDSGSNYSRHYSFGDGSGTQYLTAINQTSIGLGVFSTSSQSTGVFTSTAFDILDYRNTSKNSTLRAVTGFDNNGSGTVGWFSGAWFNTAAVTSLEIFVDSGNIAEYSSFALYGIKGV